MLFTLDEWPPGSGAGPRWIRMFRLYLKAARASGVPCGGIFRIGDVAKRGRWLCHVCGGLVPSGWAAGGLAAAPALAFAVPWADGGRFDEANARLAHYGCSTFPHDRFGRSLAQVLVRDMTKGKARAGRNDATCTSGHPLSGANLLHASDGRRRCRQCRNDRENGAKRNTASLGTE